MKIQYNDPLVIDLYNQLKDVKSPQELQSLSLYERIVCKKIIEYNTQPTKERKFLYVPSDIFLDKVKHKIKTPTSVSETQTGPLNSLSNWFTRTVNRIAKVSSGVLFEKLPDKDPMITKIAEKEDFKNLAKDIRKIGRMSDPQKAVEFIFTCRERLLKIVNSVHDEEGISGPKREVGADFLSPLLYRLVGKAYDPSQITQNTLNTLDELARKLNQLLISDITEEQENKIGQALFVLKNINGALAELRS